MTIGAAAQNGGLPPLVNTDAAGTGYAPLVDIGWSSFAKVVTSGVITRPADTTAYASGDLVANSVTAGSVTPFSFASAVSVTGGVCRIDRIRLQKSGTSVTNAQFRAHLYKATVVPVNGDNGAWSTPIASYIGAFDVTVDRAFSDGAEGSGVPLVDRRRARLLRRGRRSGACRRQVRQGGRPGGEGGQDIGRAAEEGRRRADQEG